MTEIEKMNKGLLHNFLDEDLQNLKKSSQHLLIRFNDPKTTDEERQEIQKELFGSIAGYCLIVPPFRCDYGKFIHLGERCFFNYDCMILDGCDIEIGNNVFVGPRTIISSASHPIYAPVRIECLGIQKPVVIEDNVWIGAGCIILPGARIGKNSVIGAGSVVTGAHAIPENCIACGNPCVVTRKITEEDKKEWEAMRKEYFDSL